MSEGFVILRDGNPVSGRVHQSDLSALGEFHRIASYSLDHAVRFEGYRLAPVLDVDTWGPETRVRFAREARYALRDHGHETEFVDAADEKLTRENCGACALDGYGAHADGDTAPLAPNYAGWARIYVKAGMRVREEWHAGFLAELEDENERYREALHRDVRTFGVLGSVPVPLRIVGEVTA